jgi:hypothetical protein
MIMLESRIALYFPPCTLYLFIIVLWARGFLRKDNISYSLFLCYIGSYSPLHLYLSFKTPTMFTTSTSSSGLPFPYSSPIRFRAQLGIRLVAFLSFLLFCYCPVLMTNHSSLLRTAFLHPYSCHPFPPLDFHVHVSIWNVRPSPYPIHRCLHFLHSLLLNVVILHPHFSLGIPRNVPCTNSVDTLFTPHSV